jgi:hypothetical protein
VTALLRDNIFSDSSFLAWDLLKVHSTMAQKEGLGTFSDRHKKEEPEIWQGRIVLFLEAILEKRAEGT